MSSDAEVIVRLDAALRSHDRVAARDCFSDDAVWKYPGKGPLAGRHVGWKAIERDLMAVRRLLSNDTYRAELLDVTVGDKYLVAVLRTQAEHGIHHLDITVCKLVRVVDGRIHEITNHLSDAAVHEAFWRWQ